MVILTRRTEIGRKMGWEGGRKKKIHLIREINHGRFQALRFRKENGNKGSELVEYLSCARYSDRLLEFLNLICRHVYLLPDIRVP